MAQRVIDISKYINNDAPQMVLFGKTYTVKNDKTTILLMQEMQRKAEKSSENIDEKLLKLLLGENSAKEVIEIINTSANYVENEKAILISVMALATGKEYDELAKTVEENLPSK